MNEELMTLLIILSLLLLAGAIIWIYMLKQRNKEIQRALEKSVLAEKATLHSKEAQDAMLPAKLLNLLQNGEPENFRLGAEKNIRAAVLSFNLPKFTEMIRSETSRDVFAFVNLVLNHVVPSVLYQEGEIDKFANAGLSAFYLESPERALRSAVSICEAMNQSEHMGLKYSIGLAYGDVMVGMVGHEKRFGAMTISETTGLAEFLQELAGQYGVRILVSDSMKKQIPDFEKRYNSRYLGCIYLKAGDTKEDLYEVYDGDDPADKNSKRRTKLMFEKGVELYQKKRFYDARMHFIEVLKANRMDGPAKRYLYLCNQQLEKEDTQGADAYLEIY